MNQNKQQKIAKTKSNRISLSCATWNVKRGLIKRELEIIHLLNSENIDVIFITETDTKQIICEGDYRINGYKTVFQERTNPNDWLRIVCLIKDSWVNKVTIREDLMTCDFPSIWLEIKEENCKPTVLAGFYREWTQNGDNTEVAQVERIEKFCNQIDIANESECNMIIMGDANLCSHKWNNVPLTIIKASLKVFDE